jgi:hypothetical protein
MHQNPFTVVGCTVKFRISQSKSRGLRKSSARELSFVDVDSEWD